MSQSDSGYLLEIAPSLWYLLSVKITKLREETMELLQFDAEKDELVIKIKGQDFNQLADLVAGVCSIYPSDGEAILGVTKSQARKLCDELVSVLDVMITILQQKNGR
ncbi:hypothetical protein [Methylocucumis oryzae]|uniref:Uncharacterized protein n=1 Tax=Methylocucumis oryzae TaxID=1632867 RepID=A0A0F3IDS1_9GAMM|nr:hypothetical protein [Methylocucumis oryzae]KJV04955.1 hypothetical protein VZ94_21595 [Methylocucumis oryzae]